MDVANNDITDWLDSWFPLSDSVLAELREKLQVVTVPAGQMVFRQGDVCGQYLVVLSGCVRVQAMSEAGREIVLYRVKDRESCVITTSCLLGQESYPAEGVTEEETTALAIPRPVFDQALDRSAAFRRFVFQNQGARLSDLIRRVEDVAFGRLDAKLARVLLERGGRQDGRVALTHQQLATELGTAREVVSRHLKHFEKQGWIRSGRGELMLLDSEALNALAGKAG